MEAVAPLESGVRDLQVNGFRPHDEQLYRPSRTAAVLVPFLDLPEPQLVLTRRAEHLPHHPGQVSFPGGAAEENDVSAVQTALREAWEEIGLPAKAAQPIGFLDRMDTISDYRVLPVVAFVEPDVQWALDEREVAEVFTVPASVVLNRANYDSIRYERDGQHHLIHSLRWQDRKIWGVTAGMLMNFISRLEQADERRDTDLRSKTE